MIVARQGFLRFACGLAVLLGIAAAPAGAQTFRVDTELFKNEEKEPFLATLTVFNDGTVYDFCWTEPKEVTVLDTKHGRFTLLDESRQKKAQVTTQELLDFSLALETHAAQQKEALFAFCALPKFEITEKAIEENGQSLLELSLVGKPLTYVARGVKPQEVEAARAYRQFADWCARLNATRGGNLPPGARLALNQALADRELVPLEITRTIPAAGPFGKKLEVRSEHRLNWKISGEDEKRIERASTMMATLEVISFDEYRKAPTETAAKQARK
jgi:hypothetical protein